VYSARMANIWNAHRILTRKPLITEKLVRPKKRWMIILRYDIREIGCDAGRCKELAQNHIQWWALVLECQNFRLYYQRISYPEYVTRTKQNHNKFNSK
jgi:hypothetical protein